MVFMELENTYEISDLHDFNFITNLSFFHIILGCILGAFFFIFKVNKVKVVWGESIVFCSIIN